MVSLNLEARARQSAATAADPAKAGSVEPDANGSAEGAKRSEI
jgi:hypothetical protein